MDDLRRWAELGTCVISDAADRLGLTVALLGLRPVSVARPIAGRAVTVQLGPSDESPADRHLCTEAVDASGPGDVLIVANSGRVDVAAWGGLLSLGASLHHIEGVVIDGACRDVDEAVSLAMPVYARGPVMITSRSRIVEVAWNVPVVAADRTVTPGDVVVADRSGVVAVPATSAVELLSVAEELSKREQRIAESIRSGTRMTVAMGVNYEAHERVR